MRWIFATMATLIALGSLAGCASYQLGATSELPFRTLYVEPVVNSTTMPQLSAPATGALRKAIEQNGQLRIGAKSDADATLSVRLVELKRERLAVQSDDLGRARKNLLRLSVVYSLRRPGEPIRYFVEDRELVVSQEVYNDSGQIEAESQAAPALAEKLARAAVEDLVDAW